MFGLSNVSVAVFLAVTLSLSLLFNIAVFIWFRYFSADAKAVVKEKEMERKYEEPEEASDDLGDLPF